MATRLNQVLSFTAVAAGGVVALAHEINVNGLAVVPDIVFRDNGEFAIVSVTTSTVTVRNDGAGIASLNVWLLHQHTIDRAYGASQTTQLAPNPFVPAAGGGGGSGSATVRFVTDTAIVGGDDYLLVNTTAPRTITLPDPTTTLIKEFILKDISGQSEANAISLTPFGGENIEGLAAVRELRNNFGVWRVLNDGTDWWLV